MGYAPKGEQLRLSRNVPRVTTKSFVVIASKDKIIAKMESVKSFNTTSFLQFLQAIDFPSNSVLLLDNVAFHHSPVIKTFANERGLTLLYTPPYSPWFNPIEGVFSIVKRSYYKDGNIDRAFDSVTSIHCQSFFNKSLQAV